MSKLSNVINNDVVKKTVYDKLVTKMNAINTREFVLKNQYDSDKLDLQKKSMTLTNKKTDAKISETERTKTLMIAGLVTTGALTVVKNK